jgi:hypothetical protein
MLLNVVFNRHATVQRQIHSSNTVTLKARRDLATLSFRILENAPKLMSVLGNSLPVMLGSAGNPNRHQ